MLGKLIGPKGALWRTGSEEDETGVPVSVSASQGQQPVMAQVPVSGVGAVDPEVLKDTRKATFEIPGSIYVRFREESENLKEVISDSDVRTKAAVKTLRASPAEIVKALSTTHRAALDAWKANVARAKDTGHAEKIGTREQTLRSLDDDNTRIQGEITKLQQQLQSNTERARTITQEIASAQAEIDQRARQYEAAIGVVESELAQTIGALQSMT